MDQRSMSTGVCLPVVGSVAGGREAAQDFLCAVSGMLVAVCSPGTMSLSRVH